MTGPARTRWSRCVVVALALVPWLVTAAAAGDADRSSVLRRQIVDAGMAPWNGRAIPLDVTLRGPRRETVILRDLVGKPILAYNYGEW